MEIVATCLSCGLEMQEFVLAFKFGCKQCGGRKFATVNQKREEQPVNPIFRKMNISNQVAVRVSGRGSYNINLEQLLKRKPNEPIAFQDPSGTIRLVLNPEMRQTNNE